MVLPYLEVYRQNKPADRTLQVALFATRPTVVLAPGRSSGCLAVCEQLSTVAAAGPPITEHAVETDWMRRISIVKSEARQRCVCSSFQWSQCEEVTSMQPVEQWPTHHSGHLPGPRACCAWCTLELQWAGCEPVSGMTPGVCVLPDVGCDAGVNK